MTGKQTLQGGNTYKGSAKPDDPVYKEGWQIHIGPLGRNTSEPAKKQQPSEAGPDQSCCFPEFLKKPEEE